MAAEQTASNQVKRIKALTATRSRSRSIAFIALSIAIMAVSAWVTVPLGPIPFTLQMFAMTFAIIVLEPRQAMAAILGYLTLGAIGVPVFSGMRGGIGILMGYTGGFLWGYILGIAAGSALLAVFRARSIDNFATGVAAGLLFTAISYACGTLQYMMLAQVDAPAALAVCVLPFIAVDIAKVIAATAAARGVIRALG